jgi:uncharacterized Zn-binding protein involved in type VI secretion
MPQLLTKAIKSAIMIRLSIKLRREGGLEIRYALYFLTINREKYTMVKTSKLSGIIATVLLLAAAVIYFMGGRSGQHTGWQIGAAPAVSEAKSAVAGAHSYPSKRLDIRNVFADVRIVPIDGNNMTVSVSGPSKATEGIKVTERDGTLTIEGPNLVSYRRSFAQVQDDNGNVTSITSGSGIISINGRWISESGTEQSEIAKVVVGVPRKTPIAVSDFSGLMIVGDTYGPISADINSGTAQIGHVGEARLTVSGSGDFDVAEVRGALSVSVCGFGDVMIRSGSVTTLKVSSEGSGTFKFAGEAEDADLSLTGFGDIYVNRVTGHLTERVDGSGDISIGNR